MAGGGTAQKSRPKAGTGPAATAKRTRDARAPNNGAAAAVPRARSGTKAGPSAQSMTSARKAEEDIRPMATPEERTIYLAGIFERHRLALQKARARGG